MKKLVTLTLILVLSLCTSAVHANDQAFQTSNQAPDAEAVIRSSVGALNSGDVEGALKFVADDVVAVFIPAPPGFQSAMDKKMLTAWWKTFASHHGRAEITELHAFGDKVVYNTNITEDSFTALGVPIMVGNFVALVQDDLIHSFSITFTKASQATLGIAIGRETNKAAIRRNYEELWSKGNLAVADEITDPKVIDHHSGDTGTAGLKQVITLLRKAFPDLKVTINNLVAEGDLVVADVTFDEGVYKGGLPAAFGVPNSAIGKSVKIQAMDVYRFKDGKIVEAWGLSDQLNWYKQLGVALAPPAK